MRGRSRFGDFNSVASNIYSGTAEFGKAYAWIMTAFAFVIAAVLIGLGIWFIHRPPVYPVEVRYTVTSVTPTTITTYNTKSDGTQTPSLSTVYNLIGTIPMCGDKNIILNEYTKYVIPGQTINAYVKPNCSENIASQDSDNTVFVGWICIAIAVSIIIYNLVRLYFVGNFKGIAALQGVAGGKNIFNSLF